MHNKNIKCLVSKSLQFQVFGYLFCEHIVEYGNFKIATFMTTSGYGRRHLVQNVYLCSPLSSEYLSPDNIKCL